MMHVLRRVVAAPVLLAAAVVLQVTLVNRLPLPGDAAPDLVLLVALALAVTGGPVPGMLAGFLGGLALDVAPPGSDLAGENALVFCLVGYGCGALASYQLSSGAATPREQAPLLPLPVLAAGAVAAEALRAGLGMMVSDPSMTMPAIKHVLPAAIVYDLLLSPFILLLVAVVALGRREPEGVVFSAASSAARPGASARAALRAAGAGATTRAGAVPRLTFADAKPAPLRAPSRPELAIRFSASSPSHISQTKPASAPRGGRWLRDGGGSLSGGSAHGGASGGSWPGRTPKVGFGSGGRDGVIGGSVIGRGGSGGALAGAGGRGNGLRAAAFSAGSSGSPGGSRPGAGSASRPRRPRGSAFSGGSAGGGWSHAGLGSGRSGPRGGAFKGGGWSGSAFLGGRGGTFDGVLGGGGRGGALGPSLFARAGSRGPGRNWLRGSGHPVARGAAAPGWGSAGGRAAGTARSVKRPAKGWIRTGSLTTAGWTPAGPGKGWLKPSKPPAPARRRSPGRGWLSRKPATIVWKRKSPGRGWLGHGSSHGPARTRMGGRR